MSWVICGEDRVENRADAKFFVLRGFLLSSFSRNHSRRATE